MHLFGVAFIVAGILYAIFQERMLILYFLLTVAGYLGISAFMPGGKNISNRKKIMVATWENPAEGVIQVRVPCRTEKVQALIKNLSGHQKLTMTHFVIKAAGQLIAQSADLNGKLVFGKFVPHQTIDISCLVDIDGGNDLALILVKEVDKKSVKQVAHFLKQKGSKIKKGKGDEDHKKRTSLAHHLPVFLVKVFIQCARFLTNQLGINIPALALKRHQFGAGCVTSLGTLGFEDATAPFTGFMDCVLLISANAVHQEPVVQNGQVKVGRVMHCNFVTDHRYIDGGKAKKFVKVFRHVFQNPELYVDSPGPAKEIKSQIKSQIKKQA